MMTPDQKRLVQATWQQVVPIADTAAVLFYRRLFEIDPAARKLFRATDMAEQRRKLLQVLGVAIRGLDNVDGLISTVEDLGRRHVGYGVTDAHYDSVGAALLWALEQGLAGAWTPAAASAWTEVMGCCPESCAGPPGRRAPKPRPWARSCGHSSHPDHAPCDGDEGCVGCDGLVISGGAHIKMLDFVDEALDEMPLFVEVSIIGNCARPAGIGRDHGRHVALCHMRAKPVGVERLVAKDVLACIRRSTPQPWSTCAPGRRCRADAAHCREHQRRCGFSCSIPRAIARSPVLESPFSAGCMLVRPDDRSIDDGRDFEIGVVCQSSHDALPHTRFGPAPKTFEHAVPLAKAGAQIAPWHASSRHPHDCIDEKSIVVSGAPGIAGLAWYQVLDPVPLRVRQSMANYSRLPQFGKP